MFSVESGKKNGDLSCLSTFCTWAQEKEKQSSKARTYVHEFPCEKKTAVFFLKKRLSSSERPYEKRRAIREKKTPQMSTCYVTMRVFRSSNLDSQQHMFGGREKEREINAKNLVCKHRFPFLKYHAVPRSSLLTFSSRLCGPNISLSPIHIGSK